MDLCEALLILVVLDDRMVLKRLDQYLTFRTLEFEFLTDRCLVRYVTCDFWSGCSSSSSCGTTRLWIRHLVFVEGRRENFRSALSKILYNTSTVEERMNEVDELAFCGSILLI